MELSIVEEGGVRVVEGVPDQRFMTRSDDEDLLLEACFSNRVRLALLYGRNLTDGFFDLSSGEAGAVLQRLRNYGVRLAVVCPSGSAQFSSRFGEMVAEEQRGNHFRVFETREAAREWLGGLTAREADAERPLLAPRLVGHWSLVSFEVISDGRSEYPFGPDAVGDLIYDSAGRMAVQIMKKGRHFFASGDQDDGTLEELSAAVTGYAAYFGTFSVDERAAVVTHHVTASLFPNWVGTDQHRSAVLEGDRLTLSTAMTSQGTERIFQLVWKRAE